MATHTDATREPLSLPSVGFRPSARTILIVVVLALVYSIGWRITNIDVFTLVTGLPKSERIVSGLLQPDIAAESTQSMSRETPLRIGEGAVTADLAQDGSQQLTVSPNPVIPGQELSISGSGFRPSTAGRLFLVDSLDRPRPIQQLSTDDNGAFATSFVLPEIQRADYRVRAEVTWGVGQWYLTDTFLLCIKKLVETIFLALMGTTFALLVSMPMSFLGARNLMGVSRPGWAIYYATRTAFNVLRSIEALILAIIMAVVVGIGPFAGVMALVIHSIGAMGKLYSESIESIDPGPLEAITATGANRLQVILFGVVPQVVPQFISFTMYRWDINVRLSTVIGLVGGGGIGFLLTQYIQLLQWNQAGTALWLIGITVMVMDYASAIIRERVT
ncbi:MAG TPA: phosphonate ABC transporter, permease protein PhnE [Chloroflexota bacterium]|jgi:phosphonate transport system permease protein|nr:phosphonate ABC transporter, permease protein PhnE [Chloroflexota bacterium]